MIETNKDHYSIEDLLSLMEFLRGGNGCPWDKEQTHQSIRKIATLDFEILLPGHGVPVRDGAAGKVREFAATLSR